MNIKSILQMQGKTLRSTTLNIQATYRLIGWIWSASVPMQNTIHFARVDNLRDVFTDRHGKYYSFDGIDMVQVLVLNEQGNHYAVSLSNVVRSLRDGRFEIVNEHEKSDRQNAFTRP